MARRTKRRLSDLSFRKMVLMRTISVSLRKALRIVGGLFCPSLHLCHLSKCTIVLQADEPLWEFRTEDGAWLALNGARCKPVRVWQQSCSRPRLCNKQDSLQLCLSQWALGRRPEKGYICLGSAAQTLVLARLALVLARLALLFAGTQATETIDRRSLYCRPPNGLIQRPLPSRWALIRLASSCVPALDGSSKNCAPD